MPIEKNNFNTLVKQIDTVHQMLQAKSVQTVSRSFTLRNWIIGYYIVEYEQNGEDRARYGAKIINSLSINLKHIKGMSATNLKLFRLFYSNYPQIRQTVSDQFKLKDLTLQKMVSMQSLKVPSKQLLNACSFSHFIEFLKIDDPLKKLFYEVETISHFVGWGTPKVLPMVVLTPTKTKRTNKFNGSNQNKYANICRNRDIPTYGFFDMKIKNKGKN